MGSRTVAALVALLGFAVLVGWMVRSRAMVCVLPGAVAMQPNTAIGFVAVGLSITTKRLRWLVLLPAALGVLALADYAGTNLSSGTWVIRPWMADGATSPGLMSPATAIGFIGCTLAAPIRPRLDLALVVGLCAVGGMAVLGYTTGVVTGYKVYGPWTAMAIHTAIGFIGVAVSISLRDEGDQLRSIGMLGVGAGLAVVALAVSADRSALFGSGVALSAAFVGILYQSARRIAERNRAHSKAAIAEAKLETEQASHAKAKLTVQSIAHDSRAPLDSAKKWLEAALDSLASGDPDGARSEMIRARRILRKAHQQIEHTERIHGLLDGGRELHPVAELVRDVIESRAERIEERRAVVQLDCGDVEVPIACRNVLLNLISNAVKYGGVGAHIWVRAERTETGARVAVSDNGSGFEAAVVGRLFAAGYRAHDSEDGTGMGLYHSQQTIKQLGGRIWAHSDGPGKGATFTFEVPK